MLKSCLFFPGRKICKYYWWATRIVEFLQVYLKNLWPFVMKETTSETTNTATCSGDEMLWRARHSLPGSSASRALLGGNGRVSSQGLSRADLPPNLHDHWLNLNSCHKREAFRPCWLQASLNSLSYGLHYRADHTSSCFIKSYLWGIMQWCIHVLKHYTIPHK